MKKIFLQVALILSEHLFKILFYVFHLDDRAPLKLYPAYQKVQKLQGSNFSILCTTERMRYYSKSFSWFKGNGILPNTINVVRHSTFLRLDFISLKVGDTGTYKCNVTDDPSIQDKQFELIVFGM